MLWRNLAAARADLANYVGAADACRRSLTLDPACCEAWVRLGRSLHKSGRPGDAVAAYDRAAALRADDPPALHAARFYQSLALLALGDFERGLATYESRLSLDPSAGVGSPARSFDRPRWDGGDLCGRTLLLHAEQGLGDTIQFCRYAALAADRGGRVVLQCQRPIAGLMRTVAGIDRVVASDEALPAPEFDVHLPLMSAPFALGTREATIPNRVPYLRPDPALVASFAAAARASAARSDGAWADAKLNVGVSWAGDPRHDSDRDRSTTLASLAPLGHVPGVRLFNLQKGPTTVQLATPPAGMTIVDVPRANDSMDHTAAMIANLDLVIAVDTSIAHLAGALGKPTWLALMRVPDWRWMLDREDSPWYPTMRLFRQPAAGDWASVFGRMGEELRKLVSATSRERERPGLQG